MLGIQDRRLGWITALMFVPFFLQLLGWAGTPLGGGPCGGLTSAQLLLEQPQAFFYAQIMLWGICLLMANGFFLIMLSFMNNGKIPLAQSRPFLIIAALLSSLVGLIYTLTRLTGLPTPSPLGWLMNPAEGADVLGVVVVAILAALIGLVVRNLAAPVLAPAKIR